MKSKKPLDKLEKELLTAYRKQEDLPFPPDWRHKVMNHIRSLARPAPVQEEAVSKTFVPRKIIAGAALALACLIGWVSLSNLDWYDPWITVKPTLKILETRVEFLLEAGDQDSGLRHVRVTVIQAGVEVELASYNPPTPEGFWWSPGSVKKVALPVVLDARALNLRAGPATLLITVRDLSWRNWFQGRITTLKHDMAVVPEKSS